MLFCLYTTEVLICYAWDAFFCKFLPCLLSIFTIFVPLEGFEVVGGCPCYIGGVTLGGVTLGELH